MALLFSDVENTPFALVLYVNSSPLATHAEDMYRSHASCEAPLQRCDRNALKKVLLYFLILKIFLLQADSPEEIELLCRSQVTSFGIRRQPRFRE